MFSLSNWNYGIMKKVNFIYEVNKVETLHFLLQRKWIVWKKRRRCHDDNNEWKKKYFFIKKCSVLEKKVFLILWKKNWKKEEYFSSRFLDSNSIFFDVSSFVFPNNILWLYHWYLFNFAVLFLSIRHFLLFITKIRNFVFCFCQFGIFCFSLPKSGFLFFVF